MGSIDCSLRLTKNWWLVLKDKYEVNSQIYRYTHIYPHYCWSFCCIKYYGDRTYVRNTVLKLLMPQFLYFRTCSWCVRGLIVCHLTLAKSSCHQKTICITGSLTLTPCAHRQLNSWIMISYRHSPLDLPHYCDEAFML